MKDIYVSMPETMVEKIEEEIDDKEVDRSRYIRNLVKAGHSNLANMDPRTDGSEDTENSRDLKEDILEALSDDFQPIDEAINPVVAEFESSVAHQLQKMAQDESSPVEHDPLKGYRVKND